MPDLLRQSWNRMRAFFHKAPLDHDLDAEMASHLDLAIDENLRSGLSPEEARRQALVRFGGVQQAREQQRAARGLPFLDVLAQDLRFALRTMRRDLGFSIVAVLMLGLGIGANVAAFSVVNTILLRPLPMANSDRLVWIAPPPQKCGLSCATYSADAYDEFKAQSRSYQDITGYMAFSTPDNLRLTGRGEPVPVTGIEVMANFFQTLGVQPMLGRLFTPADARHGSHPVVLLQHAYWKRQFAADPAIVGKEIDLNGSPATVVGVLPASFDFGAVFSPGARIDLLSAEVLDDERQWGNIVTLIGRLKPGVTLAQAQADANLVVPHLCWSEKYPQSCGSYAGKDGGGMELRTLKNYVSGRIRRSLELLWGAVGLILLIVCVNMSNLLLARSAARGKEFAMRSALGAQRGRIVRQLLTESLLLSAGGAALGLAIAWAVTFYLTRAGSIALPLLSSIRLDGAAMGWTLLVTLATAFLFGLMPGLKMASGSLQETLKDSGAGSGKGLRHGKIRAALVISEVALACVLVVGAGLLLRSFLRVLDVDLGFAPDHAASIKVDYDDSAPTNEASVAKRAEIFGQVIARVSALPGVEAAGIVDFLPLEQNRAWGAPTPQGKIFPEGALPSPLVYVCSPGYFRAMGMRVHGRGFTWDDNLKSQEVVLINAAAARTYWPGEDAVGKVLMSGKEQMHVIGVVDDVHASSVEDERGWQIYYSALQKGPSSAQLVIRSKVPPASMAGSVLRALRELNPNQPAAEFQPIRTIVDRAVSPRRFFVLLVGIFAALGLTLAALGIYGVIAYGVTQQTQEIGIRIALGASRARVQLGVLGKTFSLVVVGLIAGTLASLATARLMASMLFGTQPTDALTYVAMAAVLLVVALTAGYLPAWRASRINPIIALRSN
ncbi:MAG TPA: ABC transporter permease [Acidobacteriaceae bacterium]|jgi:predicted permease|nr:ABC transporter permease [Acidobacteriaceae bacterium]